tara:strand:- start:42 stop:263 length:222 start_codon:yes stop_codon:yes gene_type:complete
MNLVPVENKPGIFRDIDTNAIINKNTNDYNTYIQSRKRMKSKNERIEDLEQKVDDLSGDIGDIKSMLQSLINK